MVGISTGLLNLSAVPGKKDRKGSGAVGSMVRTTTQYGDDTRGKTCCNLVLVDDIIPKQKIATGRAALAARLVAILFFMVAPCCTHSVMVHSPSKQRFLAASAIRWLSTDCAAHGVIGNAAF